MTQMPRRLGRNLISMLLINVSNCLANVLLFAAIARRLGAESAGSFNLALTYTAVFLTLSLWGLDELLVRDVARDRHKASRYLLHFSIIRLILALGTYAALLALIRWATSYTLLTQQLVTLIGSTLIADGLSSLERSVFIAYEELGLPTFAALVEGSTKAIGGFIALWLTSDLTCVSVVFIGGSWINVWIHTLALLRLLHEQLPITRWSWHFLSQQFQQIPYFALIGFVYILMFQGDTILLSFLQGERAVGWYGVSKTIFAFSLVLSRSYQAVLYPMMSRLYSDEGMKGARIQTLYVVSLMVSLLVGFPVAIAITGLSPKITTALLGQPVAPAVTALKWTAWAALIQFLVVPNVRILLAGGRQRLVAWLLTVSMVANFLINLILIPLWGIPGAGLARFLALFVFFSLTSLAVHRSASYLPPSWQVALMDILSILNNRRLVQKKLGKER